jgi:preprotein translocase subunit SecA
VVVERQRQELAAWREELLTTGAAVTLVDERPPGLDEDGAHAATDDAGAEVDPEAEVDVAAGEDVADGEAEPVDPELRERIARAIALFHLDRCWAEHLARLAEVREGVHLRALGRLDPLDEFHRTAVPAFKQLRDEIERRTVESFAGAELTEDWQPTDVNLLRPSATWTYLVHDNPFGSELERLISSVSRRLSSRR